MFPRFSIRDLMWLTLVIAALTAWWSEHERANTAVKHSSHLFNENARLRGEREKNRLGALHRSAAVPSSKAVLK